MDYEFIIIFAILVLETLTYVFIGLAITTSMYRYTNLKVGIFRRIIVMSIIALISVISILNVSDLKDIVYKEVCLKLKGQSKKVDCSKYNWQKDIEKNEKN